VTTAIILAGGLGTRLRSVLPDLPKPMAPVNGRPFLEHLMDYWINQGVDTFILSVGYKREVIIDHFGSSYRSVPIHYSVENIPLGTGGALLLAARDLTEPLIVLNGDTFFAVSITELISFHRSKSADLSLSLFRTDDQQRFGGVQIDDMGALNSIGGESLGPRMLANGGAYFISPELIMNAGYSEVEACSLEKDLIPKFLAQGRKVFGAPFSGRFIDIGIPSDFIRAGSVLKGSEDRQC
jgi:D-glycero-alpha-D-manno-heptose 1-phosphate guanylyltransferase